MGEVEKYNITVQAGSMSLYRQCFMLMEILPLVANDNGNINMRGKINCFHSIVSLVGSATPKIGKKLSLAVLAHTILFVKLSCVINSQ